MVESFYKQGPVGGNLTSLTDLVNQELEARNVKPSRIISINTEVNRSRAIWSATVFYYNV